MTVKPIHDLNLLPSLSCSPVWGGKAKTTGVQLMFFWSARSAKIFFTGGATGSFLSRGARNFFWLGWQLGGIWILKIGSKNTIFLFVFNFCLCSIFIFVPFRPKLYVIVLILLSFSVSAQNEKKLALVIGNANYEDPNGVLKNPLNDSRLIKFT